MSNSNSHALGWGGGQGLNSSSVAEAVAKLHERHEPHKLCETRINMASGYFSSHDYVSRTNEGRGLCNCCAVSPVRQDLVERSGLGCICLLTTVRSWYVFIGLQWGFGNMGRSEARGLRVSLKWKAYSISLESRCGSLSRLWSNSQQLCKDSIQVDWSGFVALKYPSCQRAFGRS